MKLNNYIIYQYAQTLNGIFDKEDLYIPAKANFYIQKNIKTILSAAEEIDKTRFEIFKHYGQLNDTQDQYIVPNEKIEEANKELNDLFTIEQNLEIKTLKLEDLGNIELTPQQMQAIMFMIEE